MRPPCSLAAPTAACELVGPGPHVQGSPGLRGMIVRTARPRLYVAIIRIMADGHHRPPSAVPAPLNPYDPRVTSVPLVTHRNSCPAPGVPAAINLPRLGF